MIRFPTYLRQGKSFSEAMLDALKLSWSLTPLFLVTTLGRNIVVGLIPALNVWLLQTLLAMASIHASFLLLALLASGLAASSLIQGLEMQHLAGHARRKSSLFVIRKLLLAVRSWPAIKFGVEEHVTRLARARSDSSCLASITSALGRLVGDTVVLISFLWIVWHISPSIALLALVIGVPAIVVSGHVSAMEFSVEERQAKQQRFADYLARIISSPHLAKETKVFQSGPLLRKKWYDLSSSLIRESLFASLKVTFLEIVTVAVGLALFSWFLFQLLSLVEKGQVSGALFIALVPFAIALLQTTDEARMATKTLVKGLSSWKRTKEICATTSLREEKGVGQKTARQTFQEGPPHIELQSVSFRYPGEANWILEDVSLEIVPGETLALVGANGSGKTTLAHLIAGIYEPESGSVLYDKQPLSTVAPSTRARMVAFVFQSPVRYPLSMLDNISSLRYVDSETVDRVYKQLQLPQLSQGVSNLKLSMGYSDGVDISGGQWQKIALARALVDARASLFLLDEPTASLDPETEVEVFRLFRRLTQGATRIIISHRLGFAREADRIAVLDHGKLCEVGSHQQLMRRGGLYAHMYVAQSAWYAEEN